MKFRFFLLSITLGTLALGSHVQAQTNVNTGDIGTAVSATIACTNVGGLVVGGLNDLVNGSGKSGDKGKQLGIGDSSQGSQKVPTDDEKAQKKLEDQNFKEKCLDKIAYGVSRSALATQVAKTLNWVNKGAGGNPLYILNQNSYFKSIGEKQMKKYLEQTPLRDGVFGETIRNTIISQATGKPLPGGGNSAGSSLFSNFFSTTKNKALDDFNKDFRNGGWDMWQRTVDGDLNPIVAYINETGVIGKNIQETIDTVKAELQQGSGFMPQRKCAQYEEKPSMTDPNSTNYDPSYKPECLQWKTITPGAIVADQAKDALGSPMRQLELADELNEVLGSLFGKIMNKLLTKGVDGLGSFASGDYSAFGDVGVNNLKGKVSNTIEIDTASGAGNVNVKNPGSVRDVIKNQYNFLSATHDSQRAMEQIAPNLGILDYCLPGPHQTWKEEFEGNMVPFVETVINAPESGRFRDVKEVTLKDFVTGKLFTKSGFGIKVESGISNVLQGITAFLNVQPMGGSGAAITNLFVKQTDTSGVAAQFVKFFGMYEADVEPLYTTAGVVNQFTAREPEALKTSTANMIRAALTETRDLVEVYDNSSEMLIAYRDADTQTKEHIRNLERIYAEAREIVEKARIRHIAKMKAEGYTVNMACLNAVYDINPAYATRKPVEPDASNPIVEQVKKKHQEFYSNIGDRSPGNGTIEQFVEVKLE
ncbi:MAG TPA: hypothetical protein VLB02_02925 [Candidatus Paceibacterota bacterium]|nr:hypothetical protein [Candidatus Paceibacterota bacterium]